MNSRTLYLDTKPGRLFMKTAVPGAVSMLASSMYQIFDSIFVGKFIGTTAFAALGLAFPLIIINFALSDLVGIGSSVPISIMLGQKDDDNANNYFSCACLWVIVTGVFSGTLMYLIAPAYMAMMGAEGELLEVGVRYIRIYALFSLFVPILYSLDNFFRVAGRPNVSMWLNIAMSVGTVIFESVLILGFDMGIDGAAIGACSAMSICVIIGMSMFARGKMQMKFVRPRFSREMMGQIYKNGFPVFLTNVAGRVFSMVVNSLLLRFGGEGAVAVYGLAIVVCSLVEMLLYGVIDSLQPALGYNYGANRIDRVKAIEKYVMMAGLLISLVGGGLIVWIPQILAIPFLEDISLLPLAVTVLRISCVSYLFKWLSQSIQSLFMALERPLPSMIISVCNVSVFPLLLIPALLPWELTGIWWNFPITSFLTTVLALLLLYGYRRKLFQPAKIINRSV
jgi:putative MATE family efflux protein